MKCPKCKHPELKAGKRSSNLDVQECESCQGLWINSEKYETWQQQQKILTPIKWKGQPLNTHFTPSEYDTKAALCPECSRYLSRVKIPIKSPIYVERCPHSNASRCNRGEWDNLEQIKIHLTSIKREA